MPNEEISYVKLNFFNSFSQFLCCNCIFCTIASYVFDDYKRNCQENESHKIPLPLCICFSFCFVSWSCRKCFLICFVLRALLEQDDARSDSAKQTEFVRTSEPWQCEAVTGNYEKRHLRSSMCYLHTYFTIWQLWNIIMLQNWKTAFLNLAASQHPRQISDPFNTRTDISYTVLAK